MSKESVLEDCNVFITIRRNGEVVGRREGHNVWTNTGREYSCLVKSLNRLGQRFREDSIAYIGVGEGTQVETPSVSKLASPLAFSGQTYLKPLDHTLTVFPDNGSRLAIRYSAVFGPESFGGNLTHISECGLFTNGHASTFQVNSREVALSTADLQAPVAYHTFEPIPKTSNIEIEIMWELRH